MSITLYGIANCDTMKKARKWLEAHAVDYRFNDFKKQPPTREQLISWVDELGWETLLNRRGMMWRKLDQATRENIDRESAIEVMLATPSIIKRPLLDLGERRLIGFSEETYGALF